MDASSSALRVVHRRLAHFMSTARAPMVWRHDERVVVCAPYIDAERTRAEGRKIPSEDAVARPHVVEIAHACERGLGLRCEIEEEKCYSRDFWIRGRVRVTWRDDEGNLARPELDTRGKLLKAIAAEVKKYPERNADGSPGAHAMYTTPKMMFEEYVKTVAGMAGPAPGTGKKAEKLKAAGGGSRKKKGRK